MASVVRPDLETLRKEELERRRKLRLEQVRQQSKEFSNKILHKVQNEKDKLKENEKRDKELELRRWQAERIQSLEQQYQHCLDSVRQGQDENAAAVVSEEEQRKAKLLQEKENIRKARERGKAAMEKLKNDKQEEERMREEEQKQKLYTNTLEKLRSSLVTSREVLKDITTNVSSDTSQTDDVSDSQHGPFQSRSSDRTPAQGFSNHDDSKTRKKSFDDTNDRRKNIKANDIYVSRTTGDFPRTNVYSRTVDNSRTFTHDVAKSKQYDKHAYEENRTGSNRNQDKNQSESRNQTKNQSESRNQNNNQSETRKHEETKEASVVQKLESERKKLIEYKLKLENEERKRQLLEEKLRMEQQARLNQQLKDDNERLRRERDEEMRRRREEKEEMRRRNDEKKEEEEERQIRGKEREEWTEEDRRRKDSEDEEERKLEEYRREMNKIRKKLSEEQLELSNNEEDNQRGRRRNERDAMRVNIITSSRRSKSCSRGDRQSSCPAGHEYPNTTDDSDESFLSDRTWPPSTLYTEDVTAAADNTVNQKRKCSKCASKKPSSTRPPPSSIPPSKISTVSHSTKRLPPRNPPTGGLLDRNLRAFEKERLNRDFKKLLGELEHLSREERRIKSRSCMLHDDPIFHMSESRKQQAEKLKQNKMASAFEKLSAACNIDPLASSQGLFSKPLIENDPHANSQGVSINPIIEARNQPNSYQKSLFTNPIVSNPGQEPLTNVDNQAGNQSDNVAKLKELLDRINQKRELIMKEL
ncbi:hypothetical protein WDU94_002095 [Cyamophila willieti]